MAKVFISHSRKDNDISRRIAHDLIRDGAEIWIDYDRIKAGKTLPEWINNALEWCDTLILVWSKSASDSFWVKKEWESALTLQKEIIPCIIDDTPLPAILCSFVYIDFKDFNKGYEELLSALDLKGVKPPALKYESPEKIPPKKNIPIQNILKIAAIFLAMIMLGITANQTVQKIAADREAKKAYWQKRQTEMNTRFQQAQQIDSDANKPASDKKQIWQQFLIDFSADNPFSQEDNIWRKHANDRINYWSNDRVPQQKTVNGMTLVLIRGGTFDMGDTFGDGDYDEKPVHSVTVSDFYMGTTEVTNAQFAAFLNDYGKDKDEQEKTMIEEYEWSVKKIGSRWQAQPGYENHPVVYVTWYGAAQYAKWAGCRLPTEAEWEYAAREGGQKVKWSGTNIENVLGEYAWYSSNSGDKTHPVATRKPNALGLYDMSGNVWEWCSDCYDSDYYKNSPRNNPKGLASGTARVLRGGSWNYIPEVCRSADRNRCDPDVRIDFAGFRVVQDSPH